MAWFNMAKITTFKAGYCTHIACMAMRGAGLKVCQFPARAWLIEIDGYRWLWDTGYADYFNQYTQTGIFKLYQKTTPVYLNKGESLKEQFDSLGIDLASIQNIIISHFHGDHIAGLKDFIHSKFICSQEGWQTIKYLRGFNALRQGFVPDLLPIDFEKRVSFLEQFEKCELAPELAPFTFGYILPHSKKQIILVPLPGHAVGHIGAFILTDCGWTLLASDAAWVKANYKELKKPSRLAHLIMSDSKSYYQTLKQIHQLSYHPDVTIYLSHEGEE